MDLNGWHRAVLSPGGTHWFITCPNKERYGAKCQEINVIASKCLWFVAATDGNCDYTVNVFDWLPALITLPHSPVYEADVLLAW